MTRFPYAMGLKGCDAPGVYKVLISLTYVSKLAIPAMFGLATCIAVALASLRLAQAAPSPQAYKWKSVKIGGGGGFVPGQRLG